MKRQFNRILKVAVALVCTAGLLYWCFRQVDTKLFLSSLENARWNWLVLAALCTLGILFLNSFQLKLFLPKYGLISFRRMFLLVSIFSMTVNVIPFWGGHALLIYLIGQKEKVGKTVALSVITLDQIIEGFGKLFIFLLVALVAPYPEWMKSGVQGFIVLVTVSYSVFFFLSYRYRNGVSEKVVPGHTLKGRIYYVFVNWAHHLHVLRSGKKLLGTACLSVSMKILEVLAIFFIQKSLGVGLGFPEALLVAAALSLATTLPLTPGRLGLFEAGALLTYQYLGIPAAQALALGVLIHAVHTLPYIVAGYLASLKLGFRRKEIPLDVANGALLTQ